MAYMSVLQQTLGNLDPGSDSAYTKAEVLSGIRSLSLIYLQPSVPGSPRYLSPGIKFRSKLLFARSSNVELRRTRQTRAVRHTILCNPHTVFRAWHDLGTRSLDGTILLSAERLDTLLPAREGTVWRVFGVGLDKGKAKVLSFFAVLNDGFVTVARSKGSAVESARWYWSEIGISDWRDVAIWPSAPLVFTTNASFERKTGVLVLAGIGHSNDYASHRRSKSGWVPKLCRLVRSDDGVWVHLCSDQEPAEALEQYKISRQSMETFPMGVTDEDLEAIALSSA